MRIAAHGFAQGFLNGGSECVGESEVIALFAAHLNGFGDYDADVFRAFFEVIEALLDRRDAVLFGRDD